MLSTSVAQVIHALHRDRQRARLPEGQIPVAARLLLGGLASAAAIQDLEHLVDQLVGHERVAIGGPEPSVARIAGW